MFDKDSIIARYAAGTLPNMIVEIRRRTSEDAEILGTFRSTLLLLHHDLAIDLLETSRTIGDSSIEQRDFFVFMNFLCELIPDLNAAASTVLCAVRALESRAGNDLASGAPSNALLKWARQSDRARALLAAIDHFDPKDAEYLFVGLQALSKSDPAGALDIAISHVTSAAAATQAAGAKAIGAMTLTRSNSDLGAQALRTASPTADDNALGHMLTAICEISRSHPDLENVAVEMIQVCLPRVGDQTIHQVSLEIMFHGDKLAVPILAGLTAVVWKVKAGSTGTIDNLDVAAGRLFSASRLEEALAIIEPLVSRHDELVSLETLQSFCHALLQLDARKRTKTVVRWLMSLDTNLGNAASSLVGHYHGEGSLTLEMEVSEFNLSETDMVVLAHRAIGYLFIHPIAAASLILECVPFATDRALKAIKGILFEPLLLNYSGALADWLRKRAESGSDLSHAVIAEMLARLETYFEALPGPGRIEELRPSERQRLIQHHRQLESMRQMHKLAEKKSVFMSLASRSVLLYGNRSISYFGGPGAEKQRHEMKLHGYSHSIEWPRLDVLEPVELDYALRVFRATKDWTP